MWQSVEYSPAGCLGAGKLKGGPTNPNGEASTAKVPRFVRGASTSDLGGDRQGKGDSVSES